MKQNYIKYYTLGLFLLATQHLFSQQFNENQQKQLQTKAFELVEDYTNIMKQLQDTTLSYSYQINLLKTWLGNEKLLLLNDIAPDIPNAKIDYKSYVHIIKNDYPAGIIITCEPEQLSKLEPEAIKPYSNTLIVSVPINKTIIGIYKGEEIIRKSETIYLIYSYKKSGKNKLDNFKLLKIDRQPATGYPLTNFNTHSVGIFAGKAIPATGGALAFNDGTLEGDGHIISASDFLESNNDKESIFGIKYARSVSKHLGYSFGINFRNTTFDLNKNGIYSPFASNLFDNEFKFSEPQAELYNAWMNFASENNSVDNIVKQYLIDKDGDFFIPYFVYDNYSDQRKINSFEVPVFINLKFGKPTGIVFSLNFGTELSFISKVKINTEGKATHAAYYPEYGFSIDNHPAYNYQTIALTGNYASKPYKRFLLSPALSANIQIPVYDNIAFEIAVFSSLKQFTIADNFESLYFGFSEKITNDYTLEYFREQFKSVNEISSDSNNSYPYKDSFLRIPESSFHYSEYNPLGISLGITYIFANN